VADTEFSAAVSVCCSIDAAELVDGAAAVAGAAVAVIGADATTGGAVEVAGATVGRDIAEAIFAAAAFCAGVDDAVAATSAAAKKLKSPRPYCVSWYIHFS
jgi:hypothetical protein